MMIKEKSLLPKGFLFVALALMLGFAGLEIFRIGPPPAVTISPGLPAIGRSTPVAIEVSEPVRGLSHVAVEFVQGERVETLAEKNYSPLAVYRFWGERTGSDTIKVDVGRETIKGLKAGNAAIRVRAARAGTLLRHPEPVVQETVLPVRLTPPALQVTSTKTYAAQGGCELVVYKAGDASVRDGVRAGTWWFPGHELPGGAAGTRFALFAIPYDMNSPGAELVAVDEAGNEAKVSFIDQFFPAKFKSDSVEVSDGFLAKVVPEIMAQSQEMQDRGSPLENYLAINGEMRRKNAEELAALARESKQEFLWHKPFVALRNGKVMAGFADERTYRYNGRVVDHQTHLGYDLAATRHAPVHAANDGIVVLAKYFGIYGNAVVVDHGYGLMSLYGHLSSIAVSPGQQVAGGDVLGQTGETGLAGGDHLHFAMLLEGLPVNPIEWWDAHWIQDRLARKLGPGFRFVE